MKEHGTFSILATSKDWKLTGVAVTSDSTAVGLRVPHALPGVSVVATQAYTNIAYEIEGLQLLTEGLTPEKTLKKLLAGDPQREKRQVAIMDFAEGKAAFTGVEDQKHEGRLLAKTTWSLETF